MGYCERDLKDPEFNPDNWLSGGKFEHSKPPKIWSFGPRVCPGMSLAQGEILAIVATILHHFELVEPVPNNLETVFLTTLEFKNPIRIAFRAL